MPDRTPSVRACERGRIIIMRKNLSIALTLLALVSAAPLLGACHTTAGAGQDLSAIGHVLEQRSESHAVSIVEENRRGQRSQQ
jgi:predicted small secreted protein